VHELIEELRTVGPIAQYLAVAWLCLMVVKGLTLAASVVRAWSAPSDDAP
jgi:hypothetical protein